MMELWMLFAAMFGGFTLFDILVSRGKEPPSAKVAFFQTCGYISLALVYGAFVWAIRGPEMGSRWLTGFALEYSLSFDNMIALSMIMAFFGVKGKQERTVLYAGLAGAVIFRGVILGLGGTVVSAFWPALLVGAVLCFLTGKGMLTASDEDGDGEDDVHPLIVNGSLQNHFCLETDIVRRQHFIRRPDTGPCCRVLRGF